MSEEFRKQKGTTSDLDFGFDWKTRGWLKGSELIVTSAWATEDTTVTISREQIDATETITSCFLAGGTKNTTVKLTNTITTSEDRIDARSWFIDIIVR